MDAQPDGLTYKASSKFHVAFSEFTRIGVTVRQPNLMIAMEGAGLFRVTDWGVEDYAQLYKLTCEKVRDDFPVLAAEWDFAGEAPIGWVADDPEGSIVFDGQLTILNATTATNPNFSLDLQEVIHAPAVSLSFSFKCTASLSEDLEAAFIVLGNSRDESAAGIILKIEVSGGALVVRCSREDTIGIENGEWHTVVIENDTIVIDDGDPISLNPLGTNGIYLTFSGIKLPDGAVAVTLFKDVEVSCDHAL
jgi:hypothetical protein